MNDPVADLLTRIRNANLAYKDELVAPVSKLPESMLKILDTEGYIAGFDRERRRRGAGVPDPPEVRRQAPPHDLAACSGSRRPGDGSTAVASELPRVLGGLGVAIVSTSQRRDDGQGRGPQRHRRRSAGIRVVMSARKREARVGTKMSRIGKQPIEIPDGVEVDVADGNVVTVKGPRGSSLRRCIANMQIIDRRTGSSRVERPDDEGFNRSLHGLTRSLLANMVEGVTKGFEKRLQIVGVGYRAAMKGSDLELQAGYSHPVLVPQPEGIEFEVPTPTQIVVRGNDKQHGRRGRRQHPEDPQARAVQGQGHPLRGRVRPQEGRQGREGGRRVMDAKTRRAARVRRHARVRKKVTGTARRGRGWPCTARTGTSTSQLIDDRAAATIAPRPTREVDGGADDGAGEGSGAEVGS